ncbi:MAG TPA: hypothetical protein VHR47_13150 [Bacillota bacterium]|nr:hypothetical protein [Bacillota bacterium]
MLLLGLIVGLVSGIFGTTTWMRVKEPLGFTLQSIGSRLLSYR